MTICVHQLKKPRVIYQSADETPIPHFHSQYSKWLALAGVNTNLLTMYIDQLYLHLLKR